MRILGIDPGLTRCGVGIIDTDATRRATLVEVGVIRTPVGEDPALRLHAIAESIDELIVRLRPDRIAIERVFAQHNVRTVMGTAQVSGIALVAAARHSIPVQTHTPSEVKAAVTGYGKADKQQVGTMVAKILGLAEVPKPADAADALALALCHAWRGDPIAAAGIDSTSSGATPAQRAWRAAEVASGRPRRT